ncbi:type II toxin-antitoxin system RelE/ParE family toxin [Sphingomonas sp. PB4P5]|uniref:type II toxin-antitoxin system RelE/ParE family toxin n=1 Tax=Parasphingomonas puruogangriensis TaxID=3096155 RepID=UPI003FA76771
MTRPLNYLASARGDLEAIANYLEDETGSAALADAFADRLRAKCRKLAALPGSLGTERPKLQSGIPAKAT